MLEFKENKTGLIIRFENAVLETLLSQRQIDKENESGGLLFSPLSSGNIVYVTGVSDPNKFDKSKRFFFKHNKHSAQHTIDINFKKGLHYIGDWHTHPQTGPLPSQQDIKSIADILIKSKHSLNFMLHIIVGLSENPRDLYMCITDGQQIYQCSPT